MSSQMREPGEAVVALTGGTGALGRHLRRALSDRAVVLLSRRDPDAGPNERWGPADLAGPVRLPDLPPGSAVCHLAYAMADGRRNLDYTRHLVDAVNDCSNVAHVVLVSSLSVYGLGTPGRLDEESPCQPDSDYGRTKLACEQLWTTGLRDTCRLTILRPGAVLTPGGPALRRLAHDAVARPLRGTLKRALLRRSSVHFVAVDNVVAAITFVLRIPGDPRHRVFLVSDDHYPENATYAAMQDAVRSAHGLPPLPEIPVPDRLVRALGRAVRRPLGVRRTFSSRALHAAGCRDAVELREQVELVAGATRSLT